MSELKNILLVEDNKQVLEILRSSLAKNSKLNIFVATKLKDARAVLKRHRIDLISLDLILPDGDGLAFCNEIKANKSLETTKVIILTQKIDPNSRINSFENGADDYLPKPFYPQELLMRVLRLLNIHKSADSLKIPFAQYVLDLETNSLDFQDIHVSLTNLETNILKVLLEHTNYLTSQELAEYIQKSMYKKTSPTNVVVAINRLAKKLRGAIGEGIITNRYGMGYLIKGRD